MNAGGGPDFLQVTSVVRRPEFTLDVSVSVAEGEIVAVLGPNGAGKSTLLGVLAGLLRPDSGKVVVGGRVLTDTETGVQVPAHRRGVGLLAQQALLFPHLSALANVAFGPRCAGAGRAAAAATARRWLADVGVAELARRRPSQLSGGQAQRVALARALAGDPALLLLDEPLAALDIDSAPQLRALLRQVVRAAGRTALLVTHDILDALVLADRVLVLTDGGIVEHGATRDVLTRPRSPFAARIAGLNLVAGTAMPDGLRTAGGHALAGLHPGGPVPDGEPAVAVFPPSAVAVFRQRPAGSPRNAARVRLGGLEPRGEVIRLRADPLGADPLGAEASWANGLAADITPAAVADLSAPDSAADSTPRRADCALDRSEAAHRPPGGVLGPGAVLWFVVKAAEVAIHPAAR